MSVDPVAAYKTTGREAPGLVGGESRARSYEESGPKVTIPTPGNELTIQPGAAKK